MINLKRLELFLHISDASSLSDAAFTANISQPALSRQIRLLEESLGAKLFARHARGVTLTDTGEILRAEARRLIEEAKRVEEKIIDFGDTPRGEVRLGTPSSLRQLAIAPSVAELHKEYPSLTFSIREGTSRVICEALLGGEIDIAFLLSFEDHTAFDSQLLLTESLFLIGPPKALRDSHPYTVESIAKLPLVLTPSPNGLRILVERFMQKHNLRMNIVAEVESFEMAQDLTKQSGIFSIFPYCAIHDALKLGRISAQRIEGLSLSWIAATMRDKTLRSAPRAMRQKVKTIIAQTVEKKIWRSASLPRYETVAQDRN